MWNAAFVGQELGFDECPNLLAYTIEEPCCTLRNRDRDSVFESDIKRVEFEDFACEVVDQCVPSKYYEIDDECWKLNEVGML